VKVHPVEELVDRLKRGKVISREQAIKESMCISPDVTRGPEGNKRPSLHEYSAVVNKAQDADLVTTSTVMSLKCPLSTLRMELPCRSTVCPHIQCFDATSFLQLQEQAPTWTCPICNKLINFEALVVDQ
jgi:E3 SUMO-protein ligase PIAS1